MKLIRDHYLDVIERDRLFFEKDRDSQKKLLLEKLKEELLELEESNYEDKFEFADVLEVLFSIAEFKGLDRKTILSACSVKRFEKGSFNRFLVLKEENDNI